MTRSCDPAGVPAVVGLARLAFFALLVAATPGLARDLHVFQIPDKGPGQHRALAERGFDVLGPEGRGRLLVVGSDADRDYLSSWGAPAALRAYAGSTVQGKDLAGNLADYHTYAEMQALLTSLAGTYPTLAELQSMGTSIEGRDIPVLRITNGVATAKSGSRPEVLIMGNLHARELMAVEIPLRFAQYLLTNYGTDVEVTAMVDTRDIYVAPMLNPDGHVYVENNNAGDWWTWWRKNRRDNGGSIGVDLNRNFGYEWGYDDYGSSPDPSSLVYRGSGPFSEPETQAIESFCAAHDFSLALSYHSFGELLLYPWGYEFDYTVDHELFRTLGERLTAENGYLVGNPAEGAIYRTNGGSDDWAYGEILSKTSFLCFTPEVNSFDDGGFGPPDTFIVPTFDLLLPMNMRLLALADEPRRVLGPVAPVLNASPVWVPPVLTLDWSGNVPSDPNPVATYEIEEYVDLEHRPVDEADALSPDWDFDGFSLSGVAFSGSGSYYGGMANNLASTITTAAPYLVTPASQSFTFKTRYAIEQGWDYAYVQVSTDAGLTWISIAGNITTTSDPFGSNRGHGITGSTAGAWVDAVFDLSAYVGQTISLRILYNTDGSVLEEGIYVDVVGPVPTFDSKRVVAAAHPTNTIDIDIEAIATYSYRVRATDADGDTGRWSNLVSAFLDPVTAVSQAVPSWSHLAGNYPNPFNPRTLVSFTVGTEEAAFPTPVELAVFDLAGRRVRTLVSEPREAGNYRETWNGLDEAGRPAASGVYLAQLRVGGRQVASHKMTLLR